MEVVLLERVAKLGQMGDVVTVKDGYARNFLLPTGKALRANKANLAQFESQKAQLEADNLERKQDAEAVKAKMDNQSVIIIRQSGDTGQLYGSVNSRDIATALTESGFSVARNQVVLDTPIKVLGMYGIRIVLHPEVDSLIQVNVARTQEEAERQARGEVVTGNNAQDEAFEVAEDMFEEGATPDTEVTDGMNDSAETHAEESTDEDA
jgi:large subunit ribosomal protein L9